MGQATHNPPQTAFKPKTKNLYEIVTKRVLALSGTPSRRAIRSCAKTESVLGGKANQHTSLATSKSASLAHPATESHRCVYQAHSTANPNRVPTKTQAEIEAFETCLLWTLESHDFVQNPHHNHTPNPQLTQAPRIPTTSLKHAQTNPLKTESCQSVASACAAPAEASIWAVEQTSRTVCIQKTNSLQSEKQTKIEGVLRKTKAPRGKSQVVQSKNTSQKQESYGCGDVSTQVCYLAQLRAKAEIEVTTLLAHAFVVFQITPPQLNSSQTRKQIHSLATAQITLRSVANPPLRPPPKHPLENPNIRHTQNLHQSQQIPLQKPSKAHRVRFEAKQRVGQVQALPTLHSCEAPPAKSDRCVAPLC